jgi:4-amino-4-deoxy-L-arabinose transferase-like glycosyltransferase
LTAYERASARRLRDLWPVIAAVVLGLLLPCSSYDFWLPDEPRVAHTAYEMGRSSSYLLPEVNETPFLQIPPLHYWLLNFWFRLFGATDRSARYLSAAASLGTVLCLVWLARRYGGLHLALVSGAVLASTAQFWDVGHRVVVEPTLTCFLTMTFACLAVVFVERRGPLVWSSFAGLALGAAFLVKGVPGPVYVGCVCGAVLCLRRAWPTRQEFVGLLVLGVTAAVVALPWAVVFHHGYPSEFRELTVHHVLRRVFDGGVKNPSTFEFAHRSLGNLLPWAIVIPAVLLAHMRCAWGRRRGERFAARSGCPARWSGFLLLWALVPLILLTFSRSKRQLYLLPIFPPFALLTAIWLEDTFHRLSPRATRILLWGGFVMSAVGAIVAAERGVSAGHSPSWVLYGIVSLLVFIAFRWLPGRFWPGGAAGTERLAALAVLAVATWGTVYHLARSPEKAIATFCQELEQQEGAGYTIVGYQLSEREVGAVAWYLKHPIPLYDGALAGVRVSHGKSLVVGGAKDLEAWAGRAFERHEVLVEKKHRRRTLWAVRPDG